MPFLLKTEPGKYSFDDLERDGETTWDGISNNTALLNLRSMKPGEKLVIYHSVTGKDAVGTATVVSVDATDPKNPKVRIKAGKPIKQPRTLADMRAAASVSDLVAGSPSLDEQPPGWIRFGLEGGYELVCAGNHPRPPVTDDGRVDFSRTRRVKVVRIGQESQHG